MNIRGRELDVILTYHYPGVTGGVFRDGYPVSAPLPPGRLAEGTGDGYGQLHRAASVASICCYNIATNVSGLRNKADGRYLQSILYKSRDSNEPSVMGVRGRGCSVPAGSDITWEIGRFTYTQPVLGLIWKYST